jgi:hypothetical protein
MEKRSRRRTRDLVTQAASQGLSENEIGCARISMMARSTNAPCKGRIQMRKTNPLHLFTFGLQRTAGPYSWVNRYRNGVSASCSVNLGNAGSRHRLGVHALICAFAGDYVVGAQNQTLTLRPGELSSISIRAP